jgi:hypothetical protein
MTPPVTLAHWYERRRAYVAIRRYPQRVDLTYYRVDVRNVGGVRLGYAIRDTYGWALMPTGDGWAAPARRLPDHTRPADVAEHLIRMIGAPPAERAQPHAPTP